MSSSSTDTYLIDRALKQSGNYWASRLWSYDWKYSAVRLKNAAESEPLPAGRRQNTVEAAAADSKPSDPLVCRILRNVRIDEIGTLSHEGASAAVRPMALRLLAAMCKAAGRPLPMAELCHALWGRSTPASISALHTTVFRANDALLRARCPLRIGIQDRWATITYAKIPAQLKLDTHRQKVGGNAMQAGT